MEGDPLLWGRRLPVSRLGGVDGVDVRRSALGVVESRDLLLGVGLEGVIGVGQGRECPMSCMLSPGEVSQALGQRARNWM